MTLLNTAVFAVIGSTGSIGYAFTEEVLAQGHQVRLLVRNKARAQKLFAKYLSQISFIEGSATEQAPLHALMQGAQYLFIGMNVPYPQWYAIMKPALEKQLLAASRVGAALIFPGNIYNYGTTTPIKETSPEAPTTRKGRLRAEMEQMLKQYAQAHNLPVMNLRLPDFWGPNVLNDGVRPIFEGALANKALPWLTHPELPHQFVYTPDAARVAYALLQQLPATGYHLYNFGGQVTTGKELLGHVAQQAGITLRIKRIPIWLLKFMGLFNPVLKELKEMLYLWQTTIVLNDDLVRKELLPDFEPTPLPEAAQATLQWFRQR